MNSTNEINALVAEIGNLLISQQKTVTTVESCTGGGIAQALTSIPGSSQWFCSGFVTYSNEAKSNLVGVSMEMIEKYGAVSKQVARAMVMGGLARTKANYALSVTGIAGPDGGSAEKPVGTVCFGWANSLDNIDTETMLFSGNRAEIREHSVAYSLKGLRNQIEF